jgi:phosphoglycolate phosphatase
MMLVVFDVDGTLLDSQHAIVAAMSEAYEVNGFASPSREATLGIVGLSVREAVASLSAEWPDHPLDTIGASFKHSFMSRRAASPDGEPLYPGAIETLDALAARDDVLLGLATGNSRRGVGHFLARFGWESRFAAIQTADDAPSKPHPAMLQQAMVEAGVGPEQTIMVGDTTFDMAMARSAGARALGVAWGYHDSDRLLAAGAENVLLGFEDLLPALGLAAPGRAA